MSGLVAKAGAALVSMTLASSALAGGYGYGHHGHHRHGHGHGRHASDWVAPLLILGIAGAAIAASSQREAPRQVYTPPVEYRPAPTYAPAYSYAPAPQSDGPLWWCGSAGQYYPAVPYCPENWQLIQRR